MCGIIAVVRRRGARTPPAPDDVLDLLTAARDALGDPRSATATIDALSTAATALGSADALLRGVAGVRCLLAAPDLAAGADRLLAEVADALIDIERAVDAEAGMTPLELERTNVALIRVKDAAWAVQRDRLRNARLVADLAGTTTNLASIEAFTSVQIALSALDRLEVRGRDSAGLHLLVHGHQLDLESTGVRALLDRRATDPLFRSGAVRTPDGSLSFVYKAAAEIGELGDNTRALRAAVAADELLHLAVADDRAEVTVLGHTRWASVGIVSQANAHPLNSDEEGRSGEPYVVAALNGDVDNFADLKAGEGLRIAAEITTDAKVIPTLISRKLAAGVAPVEACRQTVSGFEGSVAIAASTVAAPEQVL